MSPPPSGPRHYSRLARVPSLRLLGVGFRSWPCVFTQPGSVAAAALSACRAGGSVPRADHAGRIDFA